MGGYGIVGRYILVLILALSLLSVSSVADVSATEEEALQYESVETIEGVALPLPEDQKEEWESIIDTAETRYNAPSTEPWLLYNEDAIYLVFSEKEGVVGEATVRGRTFDTTASGIQFAIADSVQFDTGPRTISEEEFEENLESYNYEYIETTIPYQQIPFAYDGTGGTVRQSVVRGSAGSEGVYQIDMLPGQFGQWLAFNISDEGEYSSQHSIVEYTDAFVPKLGHHQDYWIVDSESTIRAIVFPRFRDTPGWQTVYVDSANARGNQVSGIRTVVENTEKYEGEVITVETDLYGSSISIKDTLVSTSTCGGADMIGAPPYCVPAVVDALLHTGVAVDETSETPSMMPYASISNHEQSQTVRSTSGHYRITAEVVPAEEIDPSFSGYGLMVYEMERLGDLRTGASNRNEAEQMKYAIREQLENQLTTPQWEYEADEIEQREEEFSFATEEPDITLIDAELSPNPVQPGTPVVVTATVRNEGGDGETNTTLEFSNGTVIDYETFSIAKNEERTVELVYTSKQTGLRDLYVNNEFAGELRIDEAEENEGTDDGLLSVLPRYMIAAILLILLIIAPPVIAGYLIVESISRLYLKFLDRILK